MKVLAATTAGQGARPSDRFLGVEGELVMFPFECDSHTDDLDAGCPCRRTMAGLTSTRYTTTFQVVDLDLSQSDLVDLLIDYFKEHWGLDPTAARETATVEAEDLIAAASGFTIGEVLERRGEVIQPRR